MKLFYPALVLGLALSPLSHADCSTDSKQAALNFINSYAAFFHKNPPDPNSDQWVADNKNLTPQFKATYKKLVGDARKENFESSQDSDPIVDAQDAAERFGKVISCDKKSGVMLVSGLWDPNHKDTMEIAVKTIQKQGKWLIDGSGVINIPKKQRAPR